MLKFVVKRLARLYPQLGYKLRQAGINDKPDIYLKKTIFSALYISIGLAIFLFLTLSKTRHSKITVYLFPLIFFISLFYLLILPSALIKKKEKEISREIVYAGRFLIIEVDSGVPLYNAFLNITKNFPAIGKYFKQITERVNLGIAIEDAMNEVIELTPSSEFRRILWQIINSLRTGADVSKSLTTVIEQIQREQQILLKEYGRKLNPLAMFYMIIAVIIPSLSITFLIILSSLLNLSLNLGFLLFVSFLIAFIQFMFLAIINFLRPAVDF